MMHSGIGFSKLLISGTELLNQKRIENAAVDARILLEAASGYSHTELIVHDREIVSDSVLERYRDYIDRRMAGEPTHRITGSRNFFGREFLLSQDTLVPRDDTETLVECVLASREPKGSAPRILEIGTGSGIIAISLACEWPGVEIVATDISQAALHTAKQNAKRHGVDSRISFIESDLFHSVEGRFDILVSNPPYIASDQIEKLSAEVRNHDPAAALDGGADGLKFYRKIFAHAGRILNKSGYVALEIGFDQGASVSALAQENGFSNIKVLKDLSGNDRVVFTEGLR